MLRASLNEIPLKTQQDIVQGESMKKTTKPKEKKAKAKKRV